MAVRIYAGGNFGLPIIKYGMASAYFREYGGGIHIHDYAWQNNFTMLDRRKAVMAIDGAPVSIEIGFGEGEAHTEAWIDRVVNNYVALGLDIRFLIANAFDKENIPTFTEWTKFVRAFRKRNLNFPIICTFEWANFAANVPIIADNFVSDRKDFQRIIKYSKGMVIDTAAKYFFIREQAYRDWIVDALKWTKAAGFPRGIIISPWNSQSQYEEETVDVLKYLFQNGATTNRIIIENYHNLEPDKEYENIVGPETVDDTCLGVGWHILRTYLRPFAK